MTNLVEKRMQQAGIKSLGDHMRSGKVTGRIDPKKAIQGPINIDNLVRKSQRGDVTGLLGPTGGGKTTFIMHYFKDILKNNPRGVVAFVSLEMTLTEIAEKWLKMTENEPELANRFYIIENYDDKGCSRELSVKDIKIELTNIKNTLNETIISFAIDHLLELNNKGSTDYNPVCKDVKNLAVELDSHGFLLAQTTKGKSGVGDIPIARDGCYGTSRFEWLMTNIISIFQPLRRVEKDCKLPILGWQYAKIRYKNKEDGSKEGMNYLLKFDFETENLVPLSTDEVASFKMWYDKVLELRQNEEKFKSFQFCLDRKIKGKDGKEVLINDTFGGGSPDDEL